MPKQQLRVKGDAICLMCGTIVGQVRAGEFVHHRDCERPLRWQARLPRCCRCGGSLYFDPDISLARPADDEDLPGLNAAAY